MAYTNQTRSLRNVFISISFFVISSCATSTGVVAIGSDKLLIAKQAATGLFGTGEIKTDSIKEATAYCQSMEKMLRIIELKENEGPFILGKYPRVELIFTCD